MRYDKIPTDSFQSIQTGAGILLTEFDASTGTPDLSKMLGATKGGITFQAVPEFVDYGADIDNCPKNMKELKRLSSWTVTMSGTLITAKTEAAKMLIGAADASGNKVTPRNDLLEGDFMDELWLVADYSQYNGATKGGRVAVKLMNALSTGGFSWKTTDAEKGEFAFVFTAHYSMDAQATVPFEVYVVAGTQES